MAKSTVTYWNALDKSNDEKWEVIEGTEGQLEQLTLAIDETNGDYTRLTRFKAGADTKAFGAKSHEYPEEIIIVKGRLYDEAFDKWLEVGDYASRPPGEVHGPFVAEKECVVLEMSYPSQSVSNEKKNRTKNRRIGDRPRLLPNQMQVWPNMALQPTREKRKRDQAHF